MSASSLQNRSSENDVLVEKSHSDLELRIHGAASKVFGYGLKDFQVGATKAVLTGNNCVVVQPTGSGKSIAIFLPVLVSGKTALIIVPTVALMHTHLKFLQSYNTPVAIWGGGQSSADNMVTSEKLRKGELRAVLCAPEFLFVGSQSESRLQIIRDIAADGKLQMIAIDECHCALNWKYFRATYSTLTSVKDVADVPVLLLTATASSTSVDWLVSEYCHPSRETVRFIGTIDRPNVQLLVTVA